MAAMPDYNRPKQTWIPPLGTNEPLLVNIKQAKQMIKMRYKRARQALQMGDPQVIHPKNGRRPIDRTVSGTHVMYGCLRGLVI